MKTLHYTIIAVLAFSVLTPAFADTLTVTTDKDSYQHGDTVHVSAYNVTTHDQLLLELIAPNGNILFVDWVLPVNALFGHNYLINSTNGLWAHTGEYTINVSHDTGYITNTTFTLTNPQNQVQEIKEQWLLDFRAMTDSQKETKYAEAIKKIEKKNNAIANLKEKITKLEDKIDRKNAKIDNMKNKMNEILIDSLDIVPQIHEQPEYVTPYIQNVTDVTVNGTEPVDGKYNLRISYFTLQNDNGTQTVTKHKWIDADGIPVEKQWWENGQLKLHGYGNTTHFDLEYYWKYTTEDVWFKQWYENGQPSGYSHVNGTDMYWYENGQLYSHYYIDENGNAVKEWREDGSLRLYHYIDENGNKVVKEYYDDSSLLLHRYIDENGNKVVKVYAANGLLRDHVYTDENGIHHSFLFNTWDNGSVHTHTCYPSSSNMTAIPCP